MCRDRMGLFTPADFGLWTCGFCLQYLYVGKAVGVFFHSRHRLLVFTNESRAPVDYAPPDVDNATFVGKVCEALGRAGQDCQRWVSCCRAAQDCCQRQRQQRGAGGLLLSRGATPTPGQRLGGRTSVGFRGGGGPPGGGDGAGAVVPGDAEGGGSSAGEGGSYYCPATWDGYSCWDDTRAGSTVHKNCAGYIEDASTDGELFIDDISLFFVWFCFVLFVVVVVVLVCCSCLFFFSGPSMP